MCALYFLISVKHSTQCLIARPLLQKLRDLSVQPHILKWLTYYLSCRNQYVCVRGPSSDLLLVFLKVQSLGLCCSSSTLITSPGSLCLQALCLSVLMTCYSIVPSPRIYSEFLQEDINNFSVWATSNCLNINASKCKCMIISKRSQPTLPNSLLLVSVLTLRCLA